MKASLLVIPMLLLAAAGKKRDTKQRIDNAKRESDTTVVTTPGVDRVAAVLAADNAKPHSD